MSSSNEKPNPTAEDLPDDDVPINDEDLKFNFTYTRFNSTQGNATNGTNATTTSKPDTSTANYVLPAVYLVIWGLLFFAFVKWKRSQQAKKNAAAVQNSWFGGPTQAHQEYFKMAETLDPNSSEEVRRQLGQALMRRAIADVQRIWSLREEKQSLFQLVRQGAVGEEMWDKFQKAEEEMEAEVQEVIEEANWVKEGWGSTIFPEASQLMSRISAEQAKQGGGASSNGPRPSPSISGPARRKSNNASSSASTAPTSPVKKAAPRIPKSSASPSNNMTEEDKRKKEELANQMMEELIKEEEKEKRKLQSQMRQRKGGKK